MAATAEALVRPLLFARIICSSHALNVYRITTLHGLNKPMIYPVSCHTLQVKSAATATALIHPLLFARIIRSSSTRDDRLAFHVCRPARPITVLAEAWPSYGAAVAVTSSSSREGEAEAQDPAGGDERRSGLSALVERELNTPFDEKRQSNAGVDGSKDEAGGAESPAGLDVFQVRGWQFGEWNDRSSKVCSSTGAVLCASDDA